MVTYYHLFKMMTTYKRPRTMSDYQMNDVDMAIVPYSPARTRIPSNYRGSTFRANTRRRRTYRSNTPYRLLTYGDYHQNPSRPTPEKKTIDYGADGQNFAAATAPISMVATGISQCLNQFEQGLNENQRIGLEITILSCAYRFEIDLPANPVNQVPTSGRVILLWDRQPNSTIIQYGNVFTVANYLSFLLPGNLQRFVVLRNQQFSLSPNGSQTLFFEGYCPINMKSKYLTGGDVVPQSGALYLMYISDQAVTENQPTITGCWRVRFCDN